jgi:deoxyribodipyrimidine photolyase-related protein
MTKPGEWRLAEEVRSWRKELGVDVQVLDDDRFLCSTAAFADWAADRKQYRLEDFYRVMRRKTGLLMDGDAPAGGQWNFDRDNRKPLPAKLDVPPVKKFEPDRITQEVLDLVAEEFPDNFGALAPFWLAVTRQQAEQAFDDFVENRLALFGDYQDAMAHDKRFLFHSLAAMHINAGLLDPLEACRKVERAYWAERVPLNAAEGFVRQIIGWCEFVRGIYWQKMPDYLEQNFFDHRRPLPDFYWTGETDMACLAAAIAQTRDDAYAHHIQRLMVTGNFAMLAGIDPRAVHQWYLAVYLDAYEWVELPNTLGMSQYADGGVLASKPYAASGRYIDKMSDYCANCRFDVKKKTGPDACPFNALYWDFIARNRSKLGNNPRMAMIFATWDRMSGSDQGELRRAAEQLLESLS